MAPGNNVSFGNDSSGPTSRGFDRQRSKALSREAANSSVAGKPKKVAASAISPADENAVVAALTSVAENPDVVEIDASVPGSIQKPGEQSDPLSVGPKEFDPKSFRPEGDFGPGLY